MKDTKSVPPTLGLSRVKKMNLSANVIFMLAIIGLIGCQYYDIVRKENIYNALYISFGKVNQIEYGAKEYDTMAFVEGVENGEIVRYTKDIDTSTVGYKQLQYDISKDDVTKHFLYLVEVKDTKLPTITFNKETVYVYVGYNYDIKANIKSVEDEVDGKLEYVSSIPEENTNGYYTVTSNYNKNKIGSYSVEVKAIDKNGNESTGKYTLKVIAKPQPKKTTVSGNYTGPSSVDTSSVVNAARSLIGSRYTYAGTSPSTGFDCSGFVYYVYSLFGKHLSRTATGLASNGYAVSRGNMQPGDIIIWSNRKDNSPTHVAIYVGGNTMVHAANSRLGVISSDISFWENSNHIVGIRRV